MKGGLGLIGAAVVATLVSVAVVRMSNTAKAGGFFYGLTHGS